MAASHRSSDGLRTASLFATAALLLLLLLLQAPVGAVAWRELPSPRLSHHPRRLLQATPPPAPIPPQLCAVTTATTAADDVTNCTFLAVDAAASRRLLYGASSSPVSTSLASNKPLPVVSVVAQSEPEGGGASGAAAAPAPKPSGGLFSGFFPRAAAAPPAAAPAPPPPRFHEAAIWLSGQPGAYKVLFTSDRLGDLSGANQFVNVTLIDPTGAAPYRPLPSVGGAVPMANGGTLVPGTNGSVVVLTYQGIGARGGGLAAVNVVTGEARVIVSSAGASGGKFSAPNDVVIIPLGTKADGTGPEFYAPDGGRYAVALFTDPSYGFDQLFRTSAPERGNYLWAVPLKLPSAGAVAAAGNGSRGSGNAAAAAAAPRWWPEATGPARAIADGFTRPNGVAVTPDRRRVYVSDTAYFSGGGNVTSGGTQLDAIGSGAPVRAWNSRPRTIYQYDLSFAGAAPRTAVVANRRTFAVADVPIPDGLHVDADGQLWSGEGDGVSVYEPDTGRLLMRVRPGAGGGGRPAKVANFALVGGDGSSGGTLVMGQEQQVTAVKLPGLKVFDYGAW